LKNYNRVSVFSIYLFIFLFPLRPFILYLLFNPDSGHATLSGQVLFLFLDINTRHFVVSIFLKRRYLLWEKKSAIQSFIETRERKSDRKIQTKLCSWRDLNMGKI